MKISITEATEKKMDYNGDAKSARIDMPESVMIRSGKLGENISDLKIVIGSSRGSKRSCALSAESGKKRASITSKSQAKMACRLVVRNVPTKLPINRIRETRL